jgi:hypothetical protein
MTETLGFPWGEHPLPEGEVAEFGFGPLTFSLVRSEREIRLAGGQVAAVEGEAGVSSLTIPEQRWAVQARTQSVFVTPVYPDRPLVVAPEHPFRLAPEAEARIFVAVPLWVRMQLPDPGRTVLLEAPTVVMSDTWWGDPVGGELCYWLPTLAERQLDAGLFRTHVAVCPILIRNKSAESLGVERLVVRPAHLSVFRHERGLWADETRLRHEGGETESLITVLGKAPDEAPGATLLTPPRTPATKGFRAPTFSRIKSIAPF